MKSLAIACVFLLFSPREYGQSIRAEDRASDFDSKGVGLTETLLKFSHQEHLPIAIEYVDRVSMNIPIELSMRNKTIQQALDSILLNGNGYEWRLRNGMIEITNKHASKRAEEQLDKIIPEFKIAEGANVAEASYMLWWELQVALDPSLRQQGVGGSFLGPSTLKAAAFHNRRVREILSYIVLNSGAQGWVVAGPPKCLGFTPYCGLWYVVEHGASDNSYQFVLSKVRKNL